MNKANQTTEIINPVISRIQTLSLLAIIGFSMFIIIMFSFHFISFHFIQPELDPMTRFGSEYVVGRLGWIMNLAFFFFAGGLFLLAATFKSGLVPATGQKLVKSSIFFPSVK